MRIPIYCSLFIFFFCSCNQQYKQSEPEALLSKKNIYHCAPQTSDKDWYSSGIKAPIFKGLEGIDFRISTDNKQAQLYFNQGMMLAYGFNHA